MQGVKKRILCGVPGFVRRIVKPCAAGGHSDRDPDHDPDRDRDPDPDPDRDRDPDRDPDPDHDPDRDPDRDRDNDLSNPALSSAAFIFGSEAARP